MNLNLVTAEKKDSQGLCFIGKVRLPEFLQQQLQAKEIANFASKGQKMKGLLAAGRYKIPKEVDPAKVASYAVVASVIMNSDASITKR